MHILICLFNATILFYANTKMAFLDGRKEVVCGVGAGGKEKIKWKIISTLA